MNFYTDNMDIKLIDIDKEYEYPLKCALEGLSPDYSMFKNQLKKIQRNAIEYALKVTVELESYLVTWYTKSGWSDGWDRHDKVVTSKPDAEELKIQLINAAKFLQTPVKVEITKN